LLLGCLAVAACQAAPSRFRFEPAAGQIAGATVVARDLVRTTLAGAPVEIDLSGRQARITVAVQNATTGELEVRMGMRAAAARGAIGEVLQRPLSAAATVARAGRSEYVPYESMQPFVVRAQSRASFHLDTPLGRQPTYGQFLVLELEGRTVGGAGERRSIPLVVRFAEGAGPGRR
jgi:hypothetical protein